MFKILFQHYILFTVFLAVGLVANCEALKILVLSPNYAYSHVELHGRLADLLVERGHNLHMVIPVVVPDVDGNGTKLAQKMTRYELSDQYKEQIFKAAAQIPFRKDPFSTDIDFSSSEGKEVMKNFYGISCLNLATNQAFMAQLKAEKFDVAIADFLDICSFYTFHLLDIKTTIGTSAIPMTHNLANILGLPSPLYVPNVNTAPTNSPHLSLWQRVSNLYNSHKECNLWLDNIDYIQNLLAKSLGHPLPTVAQLVRAASFAFINSNELLEIARPTSHKVKYIGGAALKRPGKLNAEIEAIVQKSKAGVVYFSFGSLVETEKMPLTVKTAFLQTFNNFLDYEFIMKVKGKALNLSQQVAFDYPNVHLVNWVDQASLLGHPKTKAFITHCGLNSLNEAAHFGIPVVAIPMFGDQNYNSAIVNEKEIGVVLSKKELTQDTLTNALHDVLHTKKYMENMQILKRKLEKSPFKPAEVFVKTVEFAAEFQGNFKELNLAGFELNFVQYFLLDFIFLLIITAVLAICALFALSKKAMSLLSKFSMLNNSKLEKDD